MPLDSPGAKKKRTICEVHKEIYDIIEFDYSERAEKIKELLFEACSVGKYMAKTLKKYYGGKWKRDFIEINLNYKKSLKRRQHRKNCQ